MSKHFPKGEHLLHKRCFLQTRCSCTCYIHPDLLLAQENACFHKKLSTIKHSNVSISHLYHSLNSQSFLTADKPLYSTSWLRFISAAWGHQQMYRLHYHILGVTGGVCIFNIPVPVSLLIGREFQSWLIRHCVDYKLPVGQQQQSAKYETKPVIPREIWIGLVF